MNASEHHVRGIVQRVIHHRAQVKTTAGRTYDVEFSTALLQRKNGLPMKHEELAVGHVVEVSGEVWSDASMTASRLRDVSLYPHAVTCKGKVLAVDVQNSTITFQSSAYGEHVAIIGPGTIIQIKNIPSLLQNIVVGMTVTVKGTWEQTRLLIAARAVLVTYRLLNVSVVGEVVGQVGTDITVVADGVIYAVHIGTIVVRGLPNGQPLSWLVGRTVAIDAKHLAESLHLTPTRIRVVQGP